MSPPQICAHCGRHVQRDLAAGDLSPVKVRLVDGEEVTVLLCARCQANPPRWLRWHPV